MNMNEQAFKKWLNDFNGGHDPRPWNQFCVDHMSKAEQDRARKCKEWCEWVDRQVSKGSGGYLRDCFLKGIEPDQVIVDIAATKSSHTEKVC